MNPTQSLYRYGRPFETSVCNPKFIKNILGTALTSFKGVDTPFNIVANSYANIGKINLPSHLNIPGTFLKPPEIKFLSTLPVLPNLDWILEEPEEVQEQPLDVITEYQIKEYLQLFIDRLELFHESVMLGFQTLQFSIQYAIKQTLTLKKLIFLLKYAYLTVYFLSILNPQLPVLKTLEQYLNGIIMTLEQVSKKEDE